MPVPGKQNNMTYEAVKGGLNEFLTLALKQGECQLHAPGKEIPVSFCKREGGGRSCAEEYSCPCRKLNHAIQSVA
jgi:hypothetical protein